MKIECKKLLSAIEPLLPITQKRTANPILINFKIEAFGGWLTIQAQNPEEFGERTVECDGDIEPFCVNASKLVAMTRMAGESVELAVENKWLIISGAGVDRLATLGVEEYPKPPEDKMEAVAVNCEDLAEFVESVGWMTGLVSKEKLIEKPVYGAVNIVTTSNSMMTLATSGRAGARRQAAAICGDCNFSLMQEYISTFCDCLRHDESDLMLGENHVGVTFKGGRWIGRLLEEKFPTEQFLKLMSCVFNDVGLMKVSDLLPHVELANQLSNPINPEPVTIRFEEKQAVFNFSSSDSDHNHVILGKYLPETWCAYPKQLVEMMRHLKPDVEFKIKSAENVHYLTDGELDILVINVRLR